MRVISRYYASLLCLKRLSFQERNAFDMFFDHAAALGETQRAERSNREEKPRSRPWRACCRGPRRLPDVFHRFLGGANLIQPADFGFFSPSRTATPKLSTSLETSLADSSLPASVRFDKGAPSEVDAIGAVQAAIILPNLYCDLPVVLRDHHTGAVDRFFRGGTTRRALRLVMESGHGFLLHLLPSGPPEPQMPATRKVGSGRGL